MEKNDCQLLLTLVYLLLTRYDFLDRFIGCRPDIDGFNKLCSKAVVVGIGYRFFMALQNLQSSPCSQEPLNIGSYFFKSTSVFCGGLGNSINLTSY